MNRFLAAASAAAILASAPIAAYAQDAMYSVEFPFDSDRLTQEARAEVADAAAAWRSTGSADIAVEGHTDTVGTQEYNLDLSRRRAQAVQQALVSQGVPMSVISTDWVGENDLAIQTGDGVRNQENRRVTVALRGNEPSPVPQQPVAQPEPEKKRFNFAIAPYFGWAWEANDDNGDDVYMPGLNLIASYELNDNFEIEAEQAGFYALGTDNDEFGGRSVIGANIQVNAASGLFPYIGGNFGAVYGAGPLEDSLIAGPEIGFRWRFVEAKVAYDIPFDRDWGDGTVSTSIGTVFRF